VAPPPTWQTGPLPQVPVESTGPIPVAPPTWETTGSLPPVPPIAPPHIESTVQIPITTPSWDTTGSLRRIEPEPSWDTTDSLPKVTAAPLGDMETMVLSPVRPDEKEATGHRTSHKGGKTALPAGWFGRIAQVVLAMVVAVGAAVAAGYIPSPTPEPAPQQVSAHVDLTCPGAGELGGALIGAATAGAQWRSGYFGPTELTGPVFTQPVTNISSLAGDGSLAGLVRFSQAGQSTAAACAQPAATGYLQVNDADATLVLTNPDQADAVISIYLMGPKGDIESARLVDLPVPASTTIHVPLGEYAAEVAPLGITWQSTIGRVVAWVVDNSDKALDIITPTTDDHEVIVPAVTPDEVVSLVLTNPATVRIAVSVDAITSEGTLAVVGGERIMVEARSTITFDLTETLQGGIVGLRVRADRTVAVTGVVKLGTDQASIPGVGVSQLGRADIFGVVDGPGDLVLASNLVLPVPVSITTTTAAGNTTTQQVTLEAGASQVFPISPGLASIRVNTKSGVLAAFVMRPEATETTGGISIVRLPPDSAWQGVTPLWIEGQPPR